MSGVQDPEPVAPLGTANGEDIDSAEGVSQREGDDTKLADDSKDIAMTDAPVEQRPEQRERPISTTPIPIPQIPHILHSTAGQPASTSQVATPTQAQIPSATNGTSNNATSPMPARTSTPKGGAATNGAGGPLQTSGEGAGSRAASQHPADPPLPVAMPPEAAAHGAPVRQYLNSKVTGVLLEGMKLVAKEQPKDPLRMLGEFLLQRSKDLEGSG